jgi:glycosyltransferase 2 family protein
VLVFATSLSQTAFDFIHGRLLRGLASARITQRLRKLHLTYLAYRDEKGCLALFFGLTLVEQFIPILQAWVIALALGVEVSFLYIAVAVPPALLISHIPISIDGLGVFEGAFMLLIALGGVTAPAAIAIALTGRILEFLSWLPWWIAHVLGSGKVRPPQIVVESG